MMIRLGAGIVFTLAVTTALVGATRPDAGPLGPAMPVLQKVEMRGDFLDVEVALPGTDRTVAMSFLNGESTAFAVPGVPGHRYGFTRRGDRIDVWVN